MTKKKCDTNKTMTKMGMIMKRVYSSRVLRVHVDVMQGVKIVMNFEICDTTHHNAHHERGIIDTNG
jgi:hypothetical protein